MCEIFCYNSLKPKDVTQYLEKFFANSIYHPHGWGLANLSPDYYEIAKEPKKASSPIVRRFLGILKFVKDEHASKAPVPIISILSCKTIF